MRKRASGPVPRDLQLAREQIEALRAIGKVLQKCQARLPLPAPEEMAHIKKVRKTLTPETYRIGVYQRVMMAIENAVDDLHAVYEHTLRERLQGLHLSQDEVKAIEAAVEALCGSADTRTPEKP